MADQYNYFFKFSNQLVALADPIVGPYLVPATAPLQPLTVYDIGSINSIIPLSGYWVMVLAPLGVAALQSHKDLQFIADRTMASTSPRTSIIFNNLVPPVLAKNLQILTGVGIPYCSSGLDGTISVADWILATGFWNDAGFWRDTAAWID